MTRDTSYEIALDEEPPAAAKPVAVDLPGDGIVPGTMPTEGRRPIIPAGLHRGNRAASAQATAHRLGYVAAFHAVRLPWYSVQALGWSVVGMVRLIGRSCAGGGSASSTRSFSRPPATTTLTGGSNCTAKARPPAAGAASCSRCRSSRSSSRR
ncbi:hypothetical protein ACFQX6_43060 [Streptosporangium lutulentum]